MTVIWTLHSTISPTCCEHMHIAKKISLFHQLRGASIHHSFFVFLCPHVQRPYLLSESGVSLKQAKQKDERTVKLFRHFSAKYNHDKVKLIFCCLLRVADLLLPYGVLTVPSSPPSPLARKIQWRARKASIGDIRWKGEEGTTRTWVLIWIDFIFSWL